MNELASFVGSVLFIVPSVYIVHKFFHLNKSIDQYTQQVKNLSSYSIIKEIELNDPLQFNPSLIHCQKCHPLNPNVEVHQ